MPTSKASAKARRAPKALAPADGADPARLLTLRQDAQDVVLAIGDIHTPFHHPDTLAFLQAAKDRFKPTKAVFLGDEIDAHAVSDWDHDPDGMGAGDELNASIEILKDFYKLFPTALVCESNHTFRVPKKAYRAGIPTAWMRHVRDVLQAPMTWQWADHWEVDGVRYEHGESFGGQSGAFRHALYNMCPTVIGHIHGHAGIQHSQTPTGAIWGFNVGCLIDEKLYAFHYAKHTKVRPCIGVGLVDRGNPYYIMMRQDKHRRWTGIL